MDYLEIIIKGFVIGLLASMPLGPIGVMCIQRTINNKFLSGFVSGCGAASADFFFATIALFFFSFIEPYLANNLEVIKLIGGLVIAIVGLSILLKKSVANLRQNRNSKRNLLKDFFSIFGLTVTNPAYILVFLGLFSYFKVEDIDFTIFTHIIMLIGVLSGAVLWWFSLTTLVNSFRKKFTLKHIFYINRIAGVAISGIGVIAMISSIIEFIEK
ncbi:MAG: LysE family transporter [Rikenellaceae bacterium]